MCIHLLIQGGAPSLGVLMTESDIRALSDEGARGSDIPRFSSCKGLCITNKPINLSRSPSTSRIHLHATYGTRQ
jgi:hypothetical protein